jgi:hypothetical protein
MMAAGTWMLKSQKVSQPPTDESSIAEVFRLSVSWLNIEDTDNNVGVWTENGSVWDKDDKCAKI